jgi:hypothetical protein
MLVDSFKGLCGFAYVNYFIGLGDIIYFNIHACGIQTVSAVGIALSIRGIYISMPFTAAEAGGDSPKQA